jgi:hypothetical protein
MNGKPNRRWLRYSIRTLLIAITILCVWLGWNYRIVEERKAVMKLIESRGGHIIAGDPFSSPPEYPPDVSWIRTLLGDEGRYAFDLPESMPDEERARVIQAFPEADVTVLPDADLQIVE